MDKATIYNFPNKNEHIWSSFINEIQQDYEGFSSYIAKNYDNDEVIGLLLKMLVSVGQNGFLTQERKMQLFIEAEKMGIHILPTHFYNPVPVLKELEERDFSAYSTIGLNLNEDNQWKLLQRFAEYFEELSNIRIDQQNDHEYYFNNPALCGIDAMVYYAMIRYFKPKKVIEIGAGNSTKISARAANANGCTELHAIEPFPSTSLKSGFSGFTALIESKVQDVDLSFFDQLQANDILFVDNSHVSKIGSDVNHVILRILPRLKKGVIIHFHDIFIPYEYPSNWVNGLHVFWNEQYMLHSFLLHNQEFKTVLSNYYLSQLDFGRLVKMVPYSPHHIGGSYWIQRI